MPALFIWGYSTVLYACVFSWVCACVVLLADYEDEEEESEEESGKDWDELEEES